MTRTSRIRINVNLINSKCCHFCTAQHFPSALLWSRLISISIFKLGIIHPFITDNYETMFIADISTCTRSIIWYWPDLFLLFGKINIQNEFWWSQFISTSISGTGTAQHSTAIPTWTDLTDKIDRNSFIYLYLYHFPFASHDTLDAHT